MGHQERRGWKWHSFYVTIIIIRVLVETVTDLSSITTTSATPQPRRASWPAVPCDLIKSRSCIQSSPHQLIAAPSAAPIDLKPPPGLALSSRSTEPLGLIISGPRLATVRRRVWTEDLTVS